MKTLKFTETIKAPKAKVWETLWNDETYRHWTSPFMEGSYAESDWKEGSRILFLSPGGNGMYSIIEKKIPNEQMTFKHLGEVKNGVETPGDWAGAKEIYHLEEKNGTTQLEVQMDSVGEFEEYFSKTFPVALNKVKEIAEQ